MGRKNPTLIRPICPFETACGKVSILLDVLPRFRQVLQCVQKRLFSPISALNKPYFLYRQRTLFVFLSVWMLLWQLGLFCVRWGNFFDGLLTIQSKKPENLFSLVSRTGIGDLPIHPLFYLEASEDSMQTIKPVFKYSDPLCLEIAERLERLESIMTVLRLDKIKAELADKAKTSFLADMQHDMRMALTSALELSEIFSRLTDPSKAHEFSTELLNSCQALLWFLHETLESIQVASGVFSLLNEPFNLRETLENILALCQPLAIRRQLALSLEVEENIANKLIGDPVRVRRIVLELVTNALKFTETGTVRVFAKLDKQEGETAMVRISVEDTGIGIPQDKQSEIFTRFNRLTLSYQGIYKGLGLGLSTVKQFVKDLKGEIQVESEVGKGSKFSCVLPLKMAC